MNQAETIALDTISISNNELFACTENCAVKLQSTLTKRLSESSQAAKADEPFLVLHAPTEVQLESRDDFSILIARRSTGLRNWEVDPQQNIRIVWTDLATGKVDSVRIFVRPKRMQTFSPSMSGPRPDMFNAKATQTSVRVRLEMRALLRVAWVSRRYAFTLIDFDRTSNTVVTELTSSLSANHSLDPLEPTVFLREVTRPTDCPEGRARLRVVDAPSGRVRFSASLKCQVSACPTFPSVKDPKQSLFRASVLLVRRDTETPIQIDLVVPARLEGDSIGSQFQFDLVDSLTSEVPKGNYNAFLIAGNLVSESTQLSVP